MMLIRSPSITLLPLLRQRRAILTPAAWASPNHLLGLGSGSEGGTRRSVQTTTAALMAQVGEGLLSPSPSPSPSHEQRVLGNYREQLEKKMKA